MPEDSSDEWYEVIPAPDGYTSLGGTGEALRLRGPKPVGAGTPYPWPPEREPSDADVPRPLEEGD